MAEIIDIQTDEMIQEALKAETAVIFKNSTRCPVSSTARREFRTFAETCSDDIKLYMVDVIVHRQLSQNIAEKTGIKHESPQAFILRNGSVVWHGSHWSITEKNIRASIDS